MALVLDMNKPESFYALSSKPSLQRAALVLVFDRV